MKNYELLATDDGVVSMLEDGKEVTLKEAVGVIAFSVYKKTLEHFCSNVFHFEIIFFKLIT